MPNERITYTYTTITGFLSKYIFQWFGVRLAAQNTGKYNFLNRKYKFFMNMLPMSGFDKKLHREWFHSWFQDLNDNPNRRKLFHFRGSISKRSIKNAEESKDIIRYEFCSSRLTRLSLKIRQSGDYRNATYFNFEILGVSAYITLPWLPYPKFLQKYILIDTYTFDGEFKWNFLTLASSEYSWSSSDPKLPFWRKFSFNPKNFFLGDNIHFAKELAEVEDAMFSIDDTVYTINKIIFKKSTWFRSRIPYFLNNSSVTGAEIKIDKPPMHQGKGSTSYNCGDDGTYGMTVTWQPTMPRITMFGREEHNKLAEVVCREYYNHYMKDVKKRGAVNHKYLAPFKYIGTRTYLKMIEDRKNKELAGCGEVSAAKNVTNQVPMLDDSMDSNAQNINWGNIVTTNTEETKSKNSVTDNINSPSHYNSGKIEVIDFIEDQNLNFSRGNAIKYIARAGKKKGSGVDEMADVVKEIEDLGKAMWYIKREIKRISGSL